MIILAKDRNKLFLIVVLLHDGILKYEARR